MHSQECVSIHTRRMSNKPAENYNPDKATEKAHTCVRATDVDVTHPTINQVTCKRW